MLAGPRDGCILLCEVARPTRRRALRGQQLARWPRGGIGCHHPGWARARAQLRLLAAALTLGLCALLAALLPLPFGLTGLGSGAVMRQAARLSHAGRFQPRSVTRPVAGLVQHLGDRRPVRCTAPPGCLGQLPRRTPAPVAPSGKGPCIQQQANARRLHAICRKHQGRHAAPVGRIHARPVGEELLQTFGVAGGDGEDERGHAIFRARDVDARTSLQQPVHTGAGAGSHRRHQGRDPHIAPHLQPGPVLQQHVNAFNPRVVARHMHERRVAVRVLAVRLGPGLQQDGEAFTAVAQRRVTQCRVAADVSGLQIRSALHQLTNAQRTTARRRLHQRRKLTGHRELAPVWARSRIQEEADAPGVPLIGCQGQRKTRLRVMHTHLRRQQKGKAVVMPVHGGQGERGKSGVCGSGCASVEKSAHTRCVTMGGCFPERTHALRVDRVQGGAVQQQRLEFLQPVHAGGEDQWSGTTHRSN
mmetsp:Transcript_30861/g.98558  ORF Transcript_30861/g.98558 Transcript_30861/m.98558 type:complete len:473 (-) Transcript_30861:940-2358(-)